MNEKRQALGYDEKYRCWVLLIFVRIKMQGLVIYSSEYIIITKREDDFYIQSLKKGMSLDQFNRVILDHQEIGISSIMTVRNAIVNAPRPPEKFGQAKERVTVELSEDEVSAYITLCVSEEEFSVAQSSDFFKEIMRKLKENGISYGVKSNVILNNICNNTKLLVAEGNSPVNGEDSKIRTYELKETKPEAQEDGKVDHYELNLINTVEAGDWVGEKTDPTNGTSGKTVKGSILMPLKGKDLPLSYDRNTVREVYENGKTTLYARINGAVHYDGDRVGISNHMEICGNIDFKTGNIDFDGYLTIKGTIEDGFSVTATKDIEILGDYGVGGVKEITSSEGSIYIKGGIAGNNKAVIQSKNNIYTKFLSDTVIECEGSVHIGFYCLNSTIKAKEVILDSSRGQIIGGAIEAEIKVVASTIGSESEKRTAINVTGFDRKMLKLLLEKNVVDIEILKSELAKAKQEVSVYNDGCSHSLTNEQREACEKIKEEYFIVRDKLKKSEEKRKVLTGYLRTHGEGEISILKKVYPNTQLVIKKIIKEITVPILCTSFYVQDSEMKEL